MSHRAMLPVYSRKHAQIDAHANSLNDEETTE
jgi:hypothetical protein